MIFRHLTGIVRKHGRISKGALERSSNTNSRDIRGTRARVVVTLDPTKFAEKKQQRFQIGDIISFETYTTIHNQSRPVKALGLKYDSLIESGKQRHLSFPTDTKAFLYYFTTPEKPPCAGELRLRVTSSDDPASFESGSDLLKPNGRLWSRPLSVVSRFYTPLYEKLREERLVPDDLDAVLSTFPRKSLKGQFLYTLNDTFFVDFGAGFQRLYVFTEQGMEVLKFTGPFYKERVGSTRRLIPYTGSSLVRFERSTLPDHEGTRTVVLRFLKIITPVKCVIPHYDGYIMPPKEGDLHRRCGKKAIDKLNPPVWSLNIDKNVMARALQLLWDA